MQWPEVRPNTGFAEQPHAVAAQYRQDVDQDLVDESLAQTLAD